MAMKILPFLCISIFLITISSDASSQLIGEHSFSLFSLSNKEREIKIKHDYFENKITVKLSDKDSLCVYGFLGFVKDCEVLNNKFISIHFSTFGGTGIVRQHFMLIGQSEDKLFIPLHVISLNDARFSTSYISSTDSLHLYNERSIRIFKMIDLKLIDSSFTIIAEQYHYEKSMINQLNNYELRDTIVLQFDLGNKVFYNSKILLYGEYFVYNDDSANTKKQFIEVKEYPSIKINDDEYYYINGEWYMDGIEGYLCRFSKYCQ
jgi:hypothetical protein